MKPEESLHRACAQLLAVHELKGHLAWCHCPNGGKRTRAEAGILRAMGVRAGVPDLLIWLPGGRTLAIELKHTNGRLSPAQHDWHEMMARLQHPVSICTSVEAVELALGASGVPSLGRWM